MFTNVIGALTSALPKYFVFGAFVPVLIFGFLNFALAYGLSATTRDALRWALVLSTPLTIGVAFVATVAFAYVVSSVNDFLREFLEGRFVWPDALRRYLSDRQQLRRLEHQTLNRQAVGQRMRFQTKKNDWTEKLRVAASTGSNTHPGVAAYDGENGAAATALDELRKALRSPLDIPVQKVQAAVDLLATELESNDKTKDTALIRDHQTMLVMIETILNAATVAEYEHTLFLNTYFGGSMPAPTRMGNVADAMQGYAVSRYGIDLTVFMSRLQAVLVKTDAKDYPVVLDAKTQLDFLIACTWFSGLTTMVWLALVLAMRGTVSVYLAVALAGPLVTWWFYLLATENYVAYALAVRACVDVNRFGLLRALELPVPSTLHAERRLWISLNRAAGSGTPIEISYDHPAK